VRARINVFNHQIETEDACQAFLEFESGAWGLIETTTTAWASPGRAIELHGTNGTIFLADRGIAFWRFQDEDEQHAPAWEPRLPDDRPMNVIEDVVAALTRDTPVACPPDEGRKSIAVLDAVYRSAKQGGRETQPRY
jgi:predicted dehydrogenase